MIIVDSCGWLEWFTDGKLANQYKEHLVAPDNILMPAIILYEVYKILKREVGEEKALLAAGYMKNSPVIPLDDTLALIAADIALQEKLAMADAIIVAISRVHNCRIISSDADLKEQLNVDYIPKK
jgi:predicted nucleic acid-binding protein